jgi:fibronectin-binding autotransporter adhesin
MPPGPAKTPRRFLPQSGGRHWFQQLNDKHITPMLKTKRNTQSGSSMLRGYVLLITSLLFLAATLPAKAVDGTWNNIAGGSWTNTADWLGGTIADGAGSTANFNTLDLTSAATVTLDTARTIGTLVFGDPDTNSPAGWIISNNNVGANTLTVTNITVDLINPTTTATIFGSTNDAIISAVITGSGVVKKGAGTVTFQTNNTMTTLRIDEGLIAVGSATALGASNRKVSYNGGGIIISTSGTIANTNEILTTAHIYPPSGNYDAFNGPWIGSASSTIYIHATSGRFTPAGSMTGFAGTLHLADSASGLIRFNLGSGTIYDMSTNTLNTGTNLGRFAPRLTAGGQKTIKMGALTGGTNTQINTSEQDNSSITWEIGALNTDTVFDGRYTLYNSSATRPGGLTKVGTGKLTLTHSGHTYTLGTLVSNGTLALVGDAALNSTPSITVGAGAKFDVSGLNTTWGLGANQTLGGNGSVIGNLAVVNGTISPGTSVGTLTLSNNLALSGLSLTTNVFEISGVGTNDRIHVVGDLSLSDTIVLRLAPLIPTIGNGTYVLYTWGGNLTGDTNNLVLEYPTQSGTFTLNADTGAKQITLTVAGVIGPAALTWQGDGSANAWDLSTFNWLDGVTPIAFKNGDTVTLNNNGSNNVPVDITVDVNPAAVTVNATEDYTLASTTAAGIIGTGSLTKTNSGALTILNAISYSGSTLIQGGVLRIGDNANPSGSVGTGSIINNATLVYNRPDDITSPAITGSGAVIQTGSGILSLNSAGSYAGGTVVSNGTVAVGNASALGTGTATLAGGTLSFPSSQTITNPVSVVANSTLTFVNTGNNALGLNGPLSGAVGTTLTITAPVGAGANTRLRIGSGITNSFTYNGNIDLNGTFVLATYNSLGTYTFNGVISGAGTLGRRSAAADSLVASTILNGDNTFSGGVGFSQGALGFGINSTGLGPVTSGPVGTGVITFESNAGSIQQLFASGGPRTIGNDISWLSTGTDMNVIITGSNPLTFAGTVDLGANIRSLTTSNSANTIISGAINNGGLIKAGPGVLLLNGPNTYTDTTTVSAGTLGGIGTLSGPVVVSSGGTLAPGTSIGTLTINSDLTLSGNLAIEVNKSLVQSNDVTLVSGGLTNLGTGSVLVTNLGPALTAGNRFYLFDKAVVGGASLVISGGGVSWVNDLAVDGSIAVSAAPSPANITFTQIGGSQVVLNWPAGQGWKLQAQTNTLATGLASNWVEIVGATPPYTNTVSTANPATFFRLVYP